jgi:hypothetical protein
MAPGHNLLLFALDCATIIVSENILNLQGVLNCTSKVATSRTRRATSHHVGCALSRDIFAWNTGQIGLLFENFAVHHEAAPLIEAIEAFGPAHKASEKKN